jgi:hypothetical protein
MTTRRSELLFDDVDRDDRSFETIALTVDRGLRATEASVHAFRDGDRAAETPVDPEDDRRSKA